jgi:hypothetical protein
MKKQFIKIAGYEIDIRAASSSGAEDVISLLLKSNSQTALSISQILETLNKGKRRKLNRTNIDRVIRNLKRVEPQIIHSKKISNTTYYWLSKKILSKITNENQKIVGKSSRENSVNSTWDDLNTKKKRDIVLSKEKEINSESVLEKDLYPDVHGWLSNYFIDDIKFKYRVSGGGFLDNKSKFSNPDIIGINESQNIEEYKVVAVEVKRDLENKAELIGFAQCCSYLLFSHYVIFVCLKPKLPEQEDRVTRITQLCEHFGIGLRFIGENGIRVKPRLNEPKQSALKHRIIEMFQN